MTPIRVLLGGLAAVVLTVSACGSNASSEPLRTYTLHLRADDNEPDYVYIAEDAVDLRVGDRVTFEVRNDGTLDHDLQIVDPQGDDIATADAVRPGETLTLTVDFEEPGFYQLNCLVDNHLTEHNMQAIVQVTEPDD
jgi:plastocyanin